MTVPDPSSSSIPAPRYTHASIALGSNLGDRSALISTGFLSIAALPFSRFLVRSSVIQTPPLAPPGAPDQPPYLNAAVLIETRLSPRALLDALLEIELAAGRDRSNTRARGRWGPRTLDLDLLLFGDAVIHEPGLTVPHPHMHERRFVLGPLAQIAPNLWHPVLRRSIADLLADLAPPT